MINHIRFGTHQTFNIGDRVKHKDKRKYGTVKYVFGSDMLFDTVVEWNEYGEEVVEHEDLVLEELDAV